VLIAIAACVFGVGWNPPHDTTHTFTSASDYRPATDSGCTNSGAGCHGSESSYKDFNTYHPNATCTTCHAYQGVACIPCHAPNKNHECPLCHDGSMKNAPDVVRLTDNYPSGHYRETSHTAMGDDWAEEVRAQPDGLAKASCADCHTRDLRSAHTAVAAVAGSPYGADIGCGECHNDVRAFGQAEVKVKWKARTCEACHKVGSSSVMHATDQAPEVKATSSESCAGTGAGCHDSLDLHVLHADKPKTCGGSAIKGEPGCHKIGAEALVPQATTCGSAEKGSCHRADSSGSYAHKNASTAHSPSNTVPASAVFDGVTCGKCHEMAPDGQSLLAEHARPTSAMSVEPSDSCRNCHAAAASSEALADKWAAKGTTGACQACHGHGELDAVHAPDVSAKHVSNSDGCGSTGAGCHPTSELSSVGLPSTTAGLHATCLRCHALSSAEGNGVYDPSKKTCGNGRDCHNAAGHFNPATSAHEGDDSNGAEHTASASQRKATYVDLTTGLSTPCGSCHDMRLGTEHARPNSAMATRTNACTACHNAAGSPDVVKGEWPERTTDEACSACHATSGAAGIHSGISTAHIATELAPDGSPAPGSCVKAGCHGSHDLRRLHTKSGCAITGCHSSDGDIRGRNVTSCGGGNSFTACHTGYSATEHFVSHNANLTGTVNGITYGAGTNVGCFGCHAIDLSTEHARELAAGSITGAASGCRVCHTDTDDPGVGPHAAATDVRHAIATKDLRCVSCHASGSASTTADAVASPHRDIATATPLPAGKVWSDPFGDWKAALNSPTGGGHNALSAATVGASADKRFPTERFEIRGQSYTWALPPNTGSTTWLKASAFGMPSLETTEQISHLTVQCSDCHTMPADMAGPHGSAVHIGMDPAYSQTEYSDPTRIESQFTADGTERVICMKCHNMSASTNPLVNPGGNPLHARHVTHDNLSPSDPHHAGEACIDCHVRIPHAWVRPRLLVRTVVTTDGATPDAYPYVQQGYDGLAGIVLRSFSAPSDLRSGSCATNGCHAGHSATRHPLPSDIPTATYWP
jgi:hypothetical protein